nr:ISAs1 family transposase [Salinibacter ruber]
MELENGIPSHDTIGRFTIGRFTIGQFFGLLDPEAFEARFSRRGFRGGCTRPVSTSTGRSSPSTARPCAAPTTETPAKQPFTWKVAVHMVSAWARENEITLGQVKTEEKSNEITAIPELLEVLDVTGCIVTIDAMGCQKAITEAITDEGADYVLALKDNQGELRADTESIFDRIRKSDREPPEACKSVTGGHDRIETRRCWAVDVEEKGLVDLEGWHELSAVCMVEYERVEDGERAIERRYYISSLDPDAEALLKATRRHWHIENRMHWVLDVAFREDQSRIRAGHAAQNMATARRLALSLLEQEDSLSVGVKNKRLRAGWDHDYLRTVLQEA